MSTAANTATRLFCKCFAAGDVHPDDALYIPVFHRWIQEKAVPGLLIDVADYQHVPQGPNVMLIAHEGHYAMDRTAGRLGMAYHQKRDGADSFERNLKTVVSNALQAADAMANDASIDGALSFRTDEFVLGVDDRLLAPNNADTLDQLGPQIQAFFVKLLGTEAMEVQVASDPRVPFQVHIRTEVTATVGDLRERLNTL